MNSRTTWFVIRFLLTTTAFVSPGFAIAQDSASDDKQLIQWIKTASIPLVPNRQDFGPIDIQAKSAKVIGLGESTHGQHEAFELKRQLTMHLIRRHEFRVVAYEASASSAVDCNDYIAGKSNDRKKAVGGLGMLIWQVEENGKLLDDLRTWNLQASTADQVRFVGCDAQDGKAVMKRLAQLLGENNSGLIEQLNDFQEELDAALQQAMQGDPTSLETLLKESQLECEEVRKIAKKQSLDISEVDIRLKEFVGNLGLYSAPGQRDEVMAELLLAQLDLENPAEKCVFWGHNGHVQRAQLVLNGRSVPAMGGHLAKTLGDKYYAIGFDFGQGEFQANAQDENGRWRFRRYVHSAAPKGTMAALFTSATDTDFILDFRSAAKVPGVKNWLRSEQSFRSWGGYHVPDDFDDPETLPQCVPGETYDAIAFHQRTTAAQPLRLELILNK